MGPVGMTLPVPIDPFASERRSSRCFLTSGGCGYRTRRSRDMNPGQAPCLSAFVSFGSVNGSRLRSCLSAAIKSATIDSCSVPHNDATICFHHSVFLTDLAYSCRHLVSPKAIVRSPVPRQSRCLQDSSGAHFTSSRNSLSGFGASTVRMPGLPWHECLGLLFGLTFAKLAVLPLVAATNQGFAQYGWAAPNRLWCFRDSLAGSPTHSQNLTR